MTDQNVSTASGGTAGDIKPGMRFNKGNSLIEVTKLAGNTVHWRLVNGPLIKEQNEGEMPITEFREQFLAISKAA